MRATPSTSDTHGHDAGSLDGGLGRTHETIRNPDDSRDVAAAGVRPRAALQTHQRAVDRADCAESVRALCGRSAKVPDSLIERAKGMSVEEVFAILNQPSRGFRNQYEDGFQVLYPKKKMVGRAFTVQFMPSRSDLDAVVNAKGAIRNQTAIDMLQPGDVLVWTSSAKAPTARSWATTCSTTWPSRPSARAW